MNFIQFGIKVKTHIRKMTEWKPETADEIISNIQSHVKDFCNRKIPNTLPKWIVTETEYNFLKNLNND